MRKQLFAVASSVALAVAMSAPAGAIQLSAGAGNVQDTNVLQVQDRGGSRGGVDVGSGGRGSGPSGGAGVSTRGNFSAPSARGNFEPRGQMQSRDFSRDNIQSRGNETRGQFQGRDFSRGKSQSNEARGQVQSREIQRAGVDRNDFSRRDARHSDFSRWKGNKPHIVHRGWDRHHKHRFFGAFLIGVPFGYAAVSAHPCYDWLYGPQGWGYYWSYDRCPV
jgi:hypothetical protein